ncbi:hypothetical protein [Paraburkholderia humisilvae]|uniref:Extensin n=1 Tax=Paraburkholderia humisilvae TaxID=627669 RepID=A0A6J5F4N4_9BURK|nr:hypothetical protein [Paraburkholderia humisilvae]CAB3773810.1 hypothetical protein LMG29542_07446 [Paraburkholderia humisilvae]
MTKVGKTLIAALVVADLAFVFYIMSPQSDRSTGKSDPAAEGSVKTAALDPAADSAAGPAANGGAQVAAGAIANELPASATAPSATGANRTIAAAPPRPVAVPNVLLERPPAAASTRSLATASAPKETPAVTVRQQPVKTVDVANSRQSVDTKARQSSRSEQASNTGRSSDAHSSGDNPVASAMTEALVRQSAKLDPSLPPPDMSKAITLNDSPDTSSHGGANPVAAAMTEQLVRESSRINSPVHSPVPAQPGAQ